MSDIISFNSFMLSIVAAIISAILSLCIPLLLKNTNKPILLRIKQNYINNRDTLIINTISVFIFVYMSLVITPPIKRKLLANIAKLNLPTNDLHSTT